jgi:hypothetical protein
MLKRNQIVFWIAGIALLSAPIRSNAQDYAWQGFAASTAMNQMMASNRDRQIAPREQRSKSPGNSEFESQLPTDTPTDRSISNNVALSFQPSLSVRRTFLRQFVSRVRAVDPAGAIMLADFIERNDVFQLLATGIEPYGLRTDNMADAYTFWWISVWQAYHKDYSKPKRQVVQAVKKQSEELIKRLPFVNMASDQTKQGFADDLLLNALLIDAVTEEASTDSIIGEQLSRTAFLGAQSIGLDLDSIQLTDDGFRLAATNPRR